MLELLPARRTVRVRAMQVHGARVADAMPGQRVAVNLRDVELADLSRGMALAALDTLAPSEWLTFAKFAYEPAMISGEKWMLMRRSDRSGSSIES